MDKTDREAQKAELEQLCTQWAALGAEDEGRKLNLQGQIFELAFRLFPGKGEWITSLFLGEWKKFDPAKGSAYSFFAARVERRKKDADRKESSYYGHITADTIRKDDGGEESLLEKFPAKQSGDAEERMRIDADVCELISAMLELPQRLCGRANNPTRHNYFRMFFTETVAACLHGADVLKSFQKRERDTFAAMKLEFLDYFMVEQCRTAAEIAESPLKPYGELVEGREMKETALPLPNDVYVSYLDRMGNTKVGLSAISQQKKAYYQEVAKWIS